VEIDALQAMLIGVYEIRPILSTFVYPKWINFTKNGALKMPRVILNFANVGAGKTVLFVWAGMRLDRSVP
jgi:hypothetical protein